MYSMTNVEGVGTMFAIWTFALLTATAYADVINGLPSERPLVIAHRGSSGMRPEHTVEAYQLAVEQGADVIECDLAVTKDLKLICTHDAWLNATTDVWSRPEFRDRLATYVIDRVSRTDFFTVDFTMEELKTLRKIQDRPYRDQSYNGLYPMASFDEYVAVAQNPSNSRTVGIYPELKNPDFFNSFVESDRKFEDLLLSSLQSHGYTTPDSPCFVQSFDEASLRYVSNHTRLPLVYLSSLALTDAKLDQLNDFCYGVGLSKGQVVVVDPLSNRVTRITDQVEKIHAAGLKVHLYTFRNEYTFLAWDYGSDPYREYQNFAAIDGFFTDFPWSLHNYFNMSATPSANDARGSLAPSSCSMFSCLFGWLTCAHVFGGDGCARRPDSAIAQNSSSELK